MSGVFLFEQLYHGQVWRVQIADYQGRPRLSVWPWYRAECGELRPGTSRGGKGGFQIPLERLSELATALDAWLAANVPDGPPVGS